ncbi:bile acid:sodium symporter family protein [Phenylobacterium sp.]|uniref:bile acid:sodium symporter family protein n=1 Tax=Phenylobacterium sp. TaxID=1871053 RepID=UPI00301B82AA
MSGKPALLGRIKPDWYLILIISAGALASVLPARGDAAEGLGLATKIAIAMVFFLHGARLPREAVLAGLTHWRLHLTIFAATFVLFPALTLGFTRLPAWISPPELAAGLILLGCLPSTIQSSIAFVAVARGNVPAAVAAASASNLVGVFLTPALVGLLMRAEGAISPGAFWSIMIQLLLPFVTGQVLRPWIGTAVARHGALLGKLDRGTIILIVYVAFSSAVVDGVWSRLSGLDLVRLLAICAVLLAAVLAITTVAARRLGFDKADEIAIVFCGSKKSLASGAPIAAALFTPAIAGVAMIPLMVFHQLQLMVCAALAQRYARRPDTTP